MSDTARQYAGEVAFSVSARVAMQLGRESISSSVTAIIELIKNAYDADAENVTVKFVALNSENPCLVISDDGVGMSMQQVTENWMVIGTANKRNDARTAGKGRRVTGEKGLGRLGLDRLCHRTIMRSFSTSEDLGTELVIDWSKYENTEQRLENVGHHLFRIPKLRSSGTELRLEDLKDEWSEDALGDLRRELDLLVSPFAGIGDFTIKLETELGLPGVDGTVASSYLLDAALWQFTATLSDSEDITYEMASATFGETIEKKTNWYTEIKSKLKQHPQCGPLSFVFYFYRRREDARLGELTIHQAEISRFLDANQGIRIYRDGFRVKPYGDPDKGSGDWLGLSYRRQQNPGGALERSLGQWRVGSNQVVGAIFISNEQNPQLVDQTNREGIVLGVAFNHMKQFALQAIRFFEYNHQEIEQKRRTLTVYEIALKNAEASSQASIHALRELRSWMDSYGNMVPANDPTAVKLISQGNELVNQVVKVVETFREDQQHFSQVAEEGRKLLEQEKNTLGNLASLGILAASFGHETLSATRKLAQASGFLERDLIGGFFMLQPDIDARARRYLEIIGRNSREVETFAQFTLDNVRRDKRKRRKVFLDDLVGDVFSSFAASLQRQNIEVDLAGVNRVAPVRAFPIDWESIIVNLLTNAVWAVTFRPITERKISVTLDEATSMLTLDFADSGIGIDEGMEDQIFLPTVSAKRDENNELMGTGMGLTIVKGFVDSYSGGSIRVKPHGKLGGAEFIIRVKAEASIE